MDKKRGYYPGEDNKAVSLPESDWKSILPPQIYHIAREKGTERPLRKMALPIRLTVLHQFSKPRIRKKRNKSK